MVEGARLEVVCMLKYRGFESHSLRSLVSYISYNGALRQLMMNPPGSEGSNGKSTQLGASSPVIRGLFYSQRFI